MDGIMLDGGSSCVYSFVQYYSVCLAWSTSGSGVSATKPCHAVSSSYNHTYESESPSPCFILSRQQSPLVAPLYFPITTSHHLKCFTLSNSILPVHSHRLRQYRYLQNLSFLFHQHWNHHEHVKLSFPRNRQGPIKSIAHSDYSPHLGHVETVSRLWLIALYLFAIPPQRSL